MSWRSVVVVALLSVAGCAGSSDDATSDTVNPTAPATSAPEGTSAPTTPATEPSAPVPAADSVPDRAPTTSAAPAADPPGGVAPEGFEQVAARIRAPDGETCDLCVWLAATPGERAQGLMGVTDLSGADGMLFAWDEPTTGPFWMRDTPLPLSIAFFAADGSFVSSVDMSPCLDPTPDAECPRYAAGGPYTHAIEVAAGGLPALLIGPGSRLEVSGEPCPLAIG